MGILLGYKKLVEAAGVKPAFSCIFLQLSASQV